MLNSVRLRAKVRRQFLPGIFGPLSPLVCRGGADAGAPGPVPVDGCARGPYFAAVMEIARQNHLSTQPFTVWQGPSSPTELDAIEAYGDGLARMQATLTSDRPEGAQAEAIRVTDVAFIAQTAQIQWLFARMQAVVQTLNARSYRFELGGFYEDFQYTVYRDQAGGHYDWHVDQGALRVQRKLSISLQLSPGDSYEGCDLELWGANQVQMAPRERGALIAFPAYVLHRVTPIVRGVRKSLVVWTAGPNFR